MLRGKSFELNVFYEFVVKNFALWFSIWCFFRNFVAEIDDFL